MSINQKEENVKIWIKDICDSLNSDEYKDIYPDSDNYDYQEFKHPKELIDIIVINSSKFHFLNQKGLINRGFCPITGEVLDKFPMQWGMYGRNVFMSNEGVELCKKYDKDSDLELPGHTEEGYDATIKAKEIIKEISKYKAELGKELTMNFLFIILKLLALAGIIGAFFIHTSGWAFVGKIFLILVLVIILLVRFGKKNGQTLKQRIEMLELGIRVNERKLNNLPEIIKKEKKEKAAQEAYKRRMKEMLDDSYD